MKKVQEKQSNKGSLYCSLFGHNYQVSKKVTYHVKEYQCCKCSKEMTTNSNGYLTELTPKFKEINSVLERIYQNRISKYTKQTLDKPLLKMTS